MSGVLRVAAAASMILCLAFAAGCGSGGGGSVGSTGVGRATATFVGSGGFAIGEIKRLPGGTAVPTDARTLVSAACSEGRLVVKTDRESVIGQMDCSQMIPPQFVDKFRGKPVALSYNGQRLRLESASEGTVEMTVSNATVGTGDVSP